MLKDVIEIIKTRRCVRKYRDDPVPEEEIEFLIDCAKYAPSGFNLQPWSFLVIENKDVMRKISENGKKAMIPLIDPFKDTSQNAKEFLVFLKTKGTDMFYGAPVLVIILGNKNMMTTDWDCAMAAQNMMLAAHSRGIGSCWVGGVLPALMDETFLKELGAPEGYKAVAPLIFGYPKGEIKMPERSKPEIIWLK
ncbi:nitroreductase [Candidatus Methanoperedens nitroreducens]|uniref:Nitroreductase n=1 Tax=Candidatus Methanoperedens nitratireducens TaxID=1392998 RepID=A0A062VC21_9EURY|nr:nitroreductase family protein [Candidatus Methanoperedens nitroreducens]KCZ72840.1 nitroreductase [Candidatus Methanoperedens nitroreducens]MDJ1423229.1 nitroreductase family protein [Candidatus Methanoperedens sp.]